MSAEPRWLVEARRHIGQKEVPGAGNNPIIIRWWQAISAPFRDDLTPWCAGYVGGCLEAVGIRSSRSAAARSYLNWGINLGYAAMGAVVVFERGAGKGHVGFVVGRDADGYLMVLGGNQGDAVNIKPFDQRRVLGYRWPSGEPRPTYAVMPELASNGTVSRNEA